jgi:hypothetical protein
MFGRSGQRERKRSEWEGSLPPCSPSLLSTLIGRSIKGKYDPSLETKTAEIGRVGFPSTIGYFKIYSPTWCADRDVFWTEKKSVSIYGIFLLLRLLPAQFVERLRLKCGCYAR